MRDKCSDFQLTLTTRACAAFLHRKKSEAGMVRVFARPVQEHNTRLVGVARPAACYCISCWAGRAAGARARAARPKPWRPLVAERSLVAAGGGGAGPTHFVAMLAQQSRPSDRLFLANHVAFGCGRHRRRGGRIHVVSSFARRGRIYGERPRPGRGNRSDPLRRHGRCRSGRAAHVGLGADRRFLVPRRRVQHSRPCRPTAR